MFADWGTCGLTGRVLTEEELEDDFLPAEERWGRFENLAFTKTGEKSALGARGQGKFIFVAASHSHRILYDSLRPQESYRLGVRWLEKTACPVIHFDGDPGREKLREYCEDIPPLKEVGTRIIIDQPVKELIDAARKGSFARYVAVTWWEILRNQRAMIEIDCGDGRGALVIEPPSDMEMPDKDTAQHLVLVREHVPVKVGRETYHIAKLHIVAARDGPVAEDIRGVALQRGGMRVMNFQVPHIPADIANRILGYCRFEEELDYEMKALEDPTHSEFNLNRGAGRKVREIIEKEIQDFAEKRLGAPGAPSDEAAYREAAKRAIMELNRLAKNLGITLRGPVGPGPGPAGDTHPVRVTYQGGLVFPHPGSARVNYGESLTAQAVCLVNELDEAVEVKVKLYLVHKRTATDLLLIEKAIKVARRSSEKIAEPLRLHIARDVFGKGEWILRNRIVALRPFSVGREQYGKGDIVNESGGRRFWVEEDPPEAGLFEDVIAKEFAPPEEHLQHRVRSGSVADRRILEYNTVHEAFKNVKADSHRVEEYVFERACYGLIEVDLESEKHRLIEHPAKLAPPKLFTEGAKQVAKLLNTYYGG
jgi:hypothetical protein